MKTISILRLGHGYYDGGVEKDLCPAITISSWQFNNYLIEVYETDDDPDEGKERGRESPEEDIRRQGGKILEGKSPEVHPPGIIGTITTMITKDIMLCEISED